MNIFPSVNRLILTSAWELKIRFFMLSDLKCIPEGKKNSLERAVFLFHCVQSAAKGFQKKKVRKQK